MHNVRVNQIQAAAERARSDPEAARMDIRLRGAWRVETEKPQFGAAVTFPAGELTLESDFPPFLGGEGRAPTPLAYCFYGAMSCYGATFAIQAAMLGVELRSLRIDLSLEVDFSTALGLDALPPLSEFRFDVEVETDSDDVTVQRIKQLADDRCPAIWAMSHAVPYSTTARRASAPL